MFVAMMRCGVDAVSHPSPRFDRSLAIPSTTRSKFLFQGEARSQRKEIGILTVPIIIIVL